MLLVAANLRGSTFNLKDIKVLVEVTEQPCFKKNHVENLASLVYIHVSTAKLSQDDQQAVLHSKLDR